MSFQLPRIPTKTTLGDLLIDHPFLNSIIRVFLFDRLLRTLVFGGLASVITAGLFVAKLRTATPPGFAPEIKVSAWDCVQAWWLRRSANAELAEGRFDDALETWRLAISENPGDLRLVREFLGHLAQAAPSRTKASLAIQYSRRLLRLSATNLLDLELSARTCRHFGLNDHAFELLGPLQAQLSPDLEGFFLMALFERNQFARFADRWEKATARGVNLSTPELALYGSAHDAGWGLPSSAGEGQAQLDRAKDSAATRILAHRLQLKVSERLVQPETYRQSLKVLEDWQQDRLADHVSYWRLLSNIGHKADALTLIGTHHVSPDSGADAVLLARAYLDFGKSDISREILESYVPEFSDSGAVWITYGNLLIDQARWDEVSDLARLIRHDDNPLRDSLATFSYYLEGIAALRQGQRPAAEAAFKRLACAPAGQELWELVFAERIEAFGFPAAAREILLNLRRTLPEDCGYWLLLAQTAFDLPQPDLLVSAMTSAYWLRPDDPAIIRHYAAALLAARQQPAEALRLTSQLLAANPDDPAGQICHAIALCQNQHLAEAETILAGIDRDELDDEDLSDYQFAALQVWMNRGKYADARQAMALIDTKDLSTCEIQQVELARANLAKLALAGPAGRLN